MSDSDGTCEYVLDPDDPRTWGGDEDDVCYIDEGWLNEDGVWTCPHEEEKSIDTTDGEKHLCLFHLPLDEKEDTEVVEAFLDVLDIVAETDDPLTKRYGRQFIGAKFGEFNISGKTLPGTENIPIELTHARFADRVVCDDVTFTSILNLPGAIFVEEARFEGATFKQKTIFRGATFEDWALFNDAVFDIDPPTLAADFEMTNFKHASFDDATFMSKASFENATFRTASFRKAIFETGEPDVEWGGITLKGDAHFQEATFKGKANFEETIFEGVASFETVGFENLMNFRNATFKGKAYFKGAIIEGYTPDIPGASNEWLGDVDASFKNADFKSEANFSYAGFKRGLSFQNVCFEASVSFEPTIIQGKASFVNTTFGGRAEFNDAILGDEEATFEDTVFEEEVVFKDTDFKGEATFQDTSFREESTFKNGTFEQVANFEQTDAESSAIFQDIVKFNNITFEGKADFQHITFEKRADFRDTRFEEEGAFQNVIFDTEADFTNAVFCQAGFANAVFNDDAVFISDFSKKVLPINIFEGPVDFSNATARADIDFRVVKGETTLSTELVTFADEADFTEVSLSEGCKLEAVSFHEPPTFMRADIEGADCSNGDFSGATFTDANLTDTDFTQANLRDTHCEQSRLSRATLFGTDLRGAKLAGAALGDVRIDDDTQFVGHPDDDSDTSPHTFSAIRSRPTCVYDPDYEENNEHEDVDKAKSVYRALEELAGKAARPRLQARSFVRRQDLQKDEYKLDAKEADSWEERLIAGLRWSRAKVARGTLLYGESPWRIIGGSIGFIFLVSLLYPLGEWLQPVGENPITYSQILGGEWSLLLESVYFSTLTFTTLGLGDYQPMGFGKVLATLNTAFGAVLIALLVFVLGRRAAR